MKINDYECEVLKQGNTVQCTLEFNGNKITSKTDNFN